MINVLFQIVIFGAELDDDAYRMQDSKIFVRDSETDTQKLVGTLNIRDDLTREGQTYSINFEVTCGNEIELSVKHDSHQGYTKDAGISIAEIEIYNQPSQSDSFYQCYLIRLCTILNLTIA